MQRQFHGEENPFAAEFQQLVEYAICLFLASFGEIEHRRDS
ncbi:MAG TPA: hypothetical protein VKU19_35475 [Bryobacteraceae bacterium]|nr:hypothetical protein [Bryobacteraceae bacterium]